MIVNTDNVVLEFKYGDIGYMFQYDSIGDSIMIKACEYKDYYEWGVIIESRLDKSSNDTFNISISPCDLFSLIKQHHEGTLNPFIKIVFQDKFKDSTVPIVIELQIANPTKPTDIDSKFIELKPDDKITAEYRHEKKHAKRDREFEELRQFCIVKEEEIRKMRELIELLTDEISKVKVDISNIYTKPQFYEIINKQLDVKIEPLLAKISSVYPKPEANIKSVNKT